MGVWYSWITGCDANMEPEEVSRSVRLRIVGAVIAATEDAYRDNLAGGSAIRNYDDFLVSRDMSFHRRPIRQCNWFLEQQRKRRRC